MPLVSIGGCFINETAEGQTGPCTGFKIGVVGDGGDVIVSLDGLVD